MNPFLLRMALGFAGILRFRDKFLKSLAIAFTHYSVQGLLIALVGEGPATGATRLPLALQVVFFPITILPEKHGIIIPYGPILNSSVVGLIFLGGFLALDHSGLPEFRFGFVKTVALGRAEFTTPSGQPWNGFAPFRETRGKCKTSTMGLSTGLWPVRFFGACGWLWSWHRGFWERRGLSIVSVW